MDFYLMGQRIRDQRIRLHLSQAELAEKIDVSTNYIGQIERGDRKPSLETLVDLCNTLGTNMDYVLMDNLPVLEEPIIFEINTKLNQLSSMERLYFYNTISTYLEMKKDFPHSEK